MSNRKKRRHRRRQNNLLVLRLLILVVVVLVIFEGKLIITMFSQKSSSDHNAAADQGANEQIVDESENSADIKAVIYSGSSGTDAALAGIPSVTASAAHTAEPAQTAETEPSAALAEALSSDKVLPRKSPSVDDAYFSDAVFVGDSRMEGFRNASGITQGDFLTSIGMTLTSISDTQIATADGNITVYQGLSGKQYKKIYLMLGTNDLGFWPMSEFLPTAESVLNQFHQLQPNAVIYVCSVIYVEEAQVVTDYVNNENVIEVNKNLLKACEDLDFCYYINLNEIFSDGWHELIPGISQDGVHLNAPYLVQMLDYFKSHYLSDSEIAALFSSSATAESVDEAPETDDNEYSGNEEDAEDADRVDDENDKQQVGSIKILN